MDHEVNGLEVLMQEPPTITIAGRDIQMAPLGILDSVKILELFRNAWTWGLTEIAIKLRNVDQLMGINMQSLAMGLAPLLGAVDTASDILDWFATLLEVPPADLRDPRKFPMGSEFIILEGLMRHGDLQRFLSIKDQYLPMLVQSDALQAILKLTRPVVEEKPSEDSTSPSTSSGDATI